MLSEAALLHRISSSMENECCLKSSDEFLLVAAINIVTFRSWHRFISEGFSVLVLSAPAIFFFDCDNDEQQDPFQLAATDTTMLIMKKPAKHKNVSKILAVAPFHDILVLLDRSDDAAVIHIFQYTSRGSSCTSPPPNRSFSSRTSCPLLGRRRLIHSPQMFHNLLSEWRFLFQLCGKASRML